MPPVKKNCRGSFYLVKVKGKLNMIVLAELLRAWYVMGNLLFPVPFVLLF